MLDLFVRPGQELTAALWNKLVATVRVSRLQRGAGMLMRQTSDGTVLSVRRWNDWSHPFQVLWNQRSATIRKGLIDGIEPTIKSVPISGTSKQPVPTLDISAPVFDSNGMGWIAVEITCDATKWKTTKAEIKQVNTLSMDDHLMARHPIALVTQTDTGATAVFQIEYFNLQHRADGESGVPTRHFFWPA